MRQDDIYVKAVFAALEKTFARQFCEEEERDMKFIPGRVRGEKGRRQKTFGRMMAKTKQKKPICTKKGVVWGVTGKG